MVNYTDTLKRIYIALDRLGDLPIFSATINRIQQVSSSEESDAMALAMAIMRDASLSGKLLKIANSPLYNRGQTGEVTVVSRAVVMLGFERIRNLSLTLKLIEGFHNENPDIDLPGMMIRAFLNATLSSELAMRSGKRVDAEEVYIGALLFNLGEVVVAHTLPDTYRVMVQARRKGNCRWHKIQFDHLGSGFGEIGQDLAKSWGYPTSVVRSMSADEEPNHKDLVAALPLVSHRLLEQLHGQDAHDEYSYSSLTEQLTKLTGLGVDQLSEVLLKTYRHAASMANDYGLEVRRMVPPFRPSDDNNKDEMVRQLAFQTRQFSTESDNSSNGSTTVEKSRAAPADNLQLVLHRLEQLAEMISVNEPVTKILNSVVRSIEQCSSLNRVMFALISRDKQQLDVKLESGEQLEILQDYFNRRRNGTAEDMFFRVMDKGATFMVTDVDEPGWKSRLPPQFLKKVKCQGFVMMPVLVGNRLIGIFYADRLQGKGGVSDQDFRVFTQFTGQARLALIQAEHARRPQ